MAFVGSHQTLGTGHRVLSSRSSLCSIADGAPLFDDARLSDVFVGIDRTVAEVLKRTRAA